MRVGDEHPPEACRIEHRREPGEGEARIDASAARIDRVRLDARRSRGLRGVHDAGEERRRDAATPEPGSDPEAADRPDGEVVDRRNGPRAHEARRSGAHGHADPADRLVVEIGDEARRRVVLAHLPAERGRSRLATRAPLGIGPAPGLAPAATLGTAVEEERDLLPALLGGGLDPDRRLPVHTLTIPKGMLTRVPGYDDLIDVSAPPSGTGCTECLATPDGWWYHLRRCARCGHIGCCDTSPSQHASAHVRETGHTVIRSFEPGENWFYDYAAEVYLEGGPDLASPDAHPRDQPVPAPADRIPPDWEDRLH